MKLRGQLVPPDRCKRTNCLNMQCKHFQVHPTCLARVPEPRSNRGLCPREVLPCHTSDGSWNRPPTCLAEALNCKLCISRRQREQLERELQSLKLTIFNKKKKISTFKAITNRVLVLVSHKRGSTVGLYWHSFKFWIKIYSALQKCPGSFSFFTFSPCQPHTSMCFIGILCNRPT